MGRPPRVSYDGVVNTLLASLRSGVVRDRACAVAGMARSTFYDSMRHFSDFADAVTRAEHEGVARVEIEVYKGVLKDPKLGLEWLGRKDPANYAPTQKVEAIVAKYDDQIVARFRGRLLDALDYAGIDDDERARFFERLLRPRDPADGHALPAAGETIDVEQVPERP